MAELILFWHRRDLRLGDNLGLTAAWARSPRTVGVFCLDPALLQPGKVAPARITYLLGCLQALQQDYAALGGELLMVQGEPAQTLPALAQSLGAKAIYWNRDVEPYSRDRDTRVAAACKAQGIETQTRFWDQLLHGPGEVLTGSGAPYTIYGPFWRKWSSLPKGDPRPRPPRLEAVGDAAAVQAAGGRPLPSAADLGFSWTAPLPLAPGEAAALAQLERFCRRDITAYDQQRNYPAQPGTSGLSAALKFGAIGIRTLWAATSAAWEGQVSDEARQGIQTWRQELAWREFYQQVLYFFPELADGPYRPQWQNFPWENSPERFQAWCEGRTGYPIVDAAMRQLQETGWMHNRCRMIVASFLTKDLIIDWRWGERYFMETLVDGDLAANNGGWQWSASSGMDPKPLRIFNPASQAKKFDPEGEYIRQWVPEIRSLGTAALVSGVISDRDRARTGYPAPIVDHHQQQARFKAKYAAQKAAQDGVGSAP